MIVETVGTQFETGGVGGPPNFYENLKDVKIYWSTLKYFVDLVKLQGVRFDSSGTCDYYFVNSFTLVLRLF